MSTTLIVGILGGGMMLFFFIYNIYDSYFRRESNEKDAENVENQSVHLTNEK